MIKTNKLIITFLYLISFVLIMWGYYKYIVPIFGYSGFEWHPNQTKIIESLLALFLISYLLPANFKKPSDLFLHIHFILPILPMLVIYGASNEPRIYTYISVMSFLLLVLISSAVKLKPIRITKITPLLLLRLLVLLSWITIASIILMGGLKFLNFDLSKVYEIRSEAARILPGAFGYISPLVTKSIIPFAILLSIILKDRIYLLASIAASIMMFGLTAHKAPLFYPLAVIGLYYVLTKKNIIRMLVLGSLLLIVVSLVDFMLEGIWTGNLLLRRTYLVPAHLNYVYYDFFSSHVFTFWSQSKVSFGLIDYPYNLDTSHLIGYNYYGSDLTGANTGWIGSGYMNAGFAGMIIYSITLGLLFSLLNAFGRVMDKKIITSIMVIPLITVFFASDLPSAFLNHGIILSLVLISMLSNKKNIT